MRVTVLASGSSGNCLLLSEGETHILIDAGISVRRITAGLARAGSSWRELDGVLITHEHPDHISGLKTMLRREPTPVFAPRTVANRLRGMLPGIETLLREIPVGEPFPVGGLRVRAFHTPHDTPESVGYRVEGGAVFAIATDMGCVTEEIWEGLCGADTALIEANHDEQLLRYGPYPAALKLRILSEHGHLSNDNCAALARRLCENGTRRLILGHLSRENNRPALALEAVQSALTGLDAAVCCAPEDGFLTVPVGE